MAQQQPSNDVVIVKQPGPVPNKFVCCALLCCAESIICSEYYCGCANNGSCLCCEDRSATKIGFRQCKCCDCVNGCDFWCCHNKSRCKCDCSKWTLCGSSSMCCCWESTCSFPPKPYQPIQCGCCNIVCLGTATEPSPALDTIRADGTTFN